MIDRDSLITSRQNAGVKRLCAISEKKAREAERVFRFDGSKLFLEAVACGVEIEKVYICETSAESIAQKVGSELSMLEHDKVVYLSEHVFQKVTDERAPEGIITVAKYIDKSHKSVTINNEEEFLPGREECVMLIESVRDPGNLGTMIRSAAALGIDRLIISSDCADIYNPKTIRAAMGGLFRLNIDKLDSGLSMSRYIGALRDGGRRVFAAALDTDALTLGDAELKSGDCIVIGNEGHGLSRDTIDSCDRSIIIPMSAGCESLNAAAAAVIFMWEMHRAKK